MVFIWIGLAVLLITASANVISMLPLIGGIVPDFFSSYNFILYPIGFFLIIFQFTQQWGMIGIVLSLIATAILAFALGVIGV